MVQFKVVATGGTFDVIHQGHVALLDESFLISDKVIIGLTSDELAKKKGKTLWHNYSQRFDTLEKLIKKRFPGKPYTISKLENDFGPAAIEGDVQALVVSEETAYQGDVLNELRRQKNMPSVKVVVVPLVLAEDGKRISSTRIRNSEIDTQGNLL